MMPMAIVSMGALCAVMLVVAAALMLRVSDRELRLASRVEAARGHWAKPDNKTGAAKSAGMRGAALQLIGSVGQGIVLSGILPGKTRSELQVTLAASGFRGSNALALFLGSKLVLLAGLPVAAWFLTPGLLGLDGPAHTFATAIAAALGLMLPDKIITRLRQASLRRLEAGLPDALDLMVICAQAGLSMTPAMLRVVHELRTSRPDITRELDETVRELEMVADATIALTNLGRRSGLDSLKRLGSTLGQTLQYGTPLSEALRVLSNELRQQMLTRFEERAARLPVLLTLPMILLILPCVFIIVGGPAVLKVMESLG
ncbi:MAG: type II secretion system F family protein [Gemmatimonadaceae bacterium]|nr:type II secretion system F family protein [Acetobacteraceae bacterium]